MPTIITHAAIGSAGAVAGRGRTEAARLWLLSIMCAILPDADVLGFSFGVAYGDYFGHRGFFHSPFFALIVSIFVVLVFYRDERILSVRWWLLALYFWLIGCSHGILDAMTNGGRGIALLAPFDSGRYFLPWTPIKVAPIGIEAFFSEWGARVLLNEILVVWIPVGILLAAWPVIRRRLARNSQNPTWTNR